MSNTPFPKLALVTGATAGIGRALCYLLAEQGISLIAVGRNLPALDSLVRDLQPRVPITALQLDLCQPEERQRLIQIIQQRVPDLVINNAGHGWRGAIVEEEETAQLSILTLNVWALTELTLAAAKALYQAGKSGTIVNISSVMSYLVAPNFAVYSASKTFVTALSQSLDEELKPYAIRVLASCPGRVATNFGRQRPTSACHNILLSTLCISAEQAAAHILAQVKSGRPVYIFPWFNRLLLLLSRLIPRSLLGAFMRTL